MTIFCLPGNVVFDTFSLAFFLDVILSWFQHRMFHIHFVLKTLFVIGNVIPFDNSSNLYLLGNVEEGFVFVPGSFGNIATS